MQYGVIITAENYSQIISRNNRSLSPIFSDAIAFTCVEHNKKDYFFSNRGIELTFNYLAEIIDYEESEKDKLEEIIKLKTIELISIVDEKNTELRKFQGAQGNKEALDLVLKNLKKKVDA
jgi:hypothetical protein